MLDAHRPPLKRASSENKLSTPIAQPTEIPQAAALPSEKIIPQSNIVHSPVTNLIDLKSQEDKNIDFGSPLASPIGNSDEESPSSVTSFKSFRFFPQTMNKNPEKNAPELFQRIKQRFDGRQTQTLTPEDIKNTLSALMTIKKVQPPNLGATSKHWDVTLEQFEGNKSWLLRNDEDEYFDSLNINQLLQERDVRGHGRQVNALLNAQSNISSTWDDLFKMLCRPILIQHPHTKKALWVIIDMKLKEHDAQPSKDILVLDVTLRPTVSPSMQDSNDYGKRKYVHFTSLLHERHTPLPPSHLASEFTPKETLIGEPESYYFEQKGM